MLCCYWVNPKLFAFYSSQLPDKEPCRAFVFTVQIHRNHSILANLLSRVWKQAAVMMFM